MIRKIKKILKSVPTIEGAGVNLKRVFGYHQIPELDPFLLLDEFKSDNPDDYIKGFPWHPHRGIETITYLLDGSVEHGDSLGNKGVISSGDVQWMTAGSGIIHQEMPKGSKNRAMWGTQLWANLPASEKMTEPKYRDITSDQIPQIEIESSVKIKIICGEVNGVKGPVEDIAIKPQYLDITIPAGKKYIHKTQNEYTVFSYILDGEGYFEPERDPYSFEIAGKNYFDFKRECRIGYESLVIYEKGDEVEITAGEKDLRFLLLSGRPLGEPIAWYGPIVMNTQEEIKTAFDEYRNGTFLKHNP